MYILGHTAFAYLACRFGYLARRRDPDPKIIFLIMVFANIPDAVHFGILREVTHNFIGTVLFALLCLLVLERAKLVQAKDFPILMFAALTHALTDILFSGYRITFPFGYYNYTMFAFNSQTHLIVEGIVGFGLVVALHFSGDLKRMTAMARAEQGRLVAHKGSWTGLVPTTLLAFFFIAYSLLTAGQLSGAMATNKDALLSGSWPAWFFISAFVSFLFCLNVIAFAKGEKALHEERMEGR